MPESAQPTVVLVHGAFADASGFGGIIREVSTWGYRVLAPPNPLQGLTIIPPPRRTARPAVPTQTGPLAGGPGPPTGQRAARRRRKRGCRRAFPLAGRSRTRVPGQRATAGRTRARCRPVEVQRQFHHCEGVRATSSRGRRSGTHVGLPRADGCWANDTCGSAASSHPALDRSRAKVATVGDFHQHTPADGRSAIDFRSGRLAQRRCPCWRTMTSSTSVALALSPRMASSSAAGSLVARAHGFRSRRPSTSVSR
jgi:hypothetical protein